MEYYAKSPAVVMGEAKKEQVRKDLHMVMGTLREEADKKELAILQKYEKSLAKDPETEQKTLRDHLAETVQCAEDFFGVYGGYFTEKEKRLILYVCRMHDVGKANYVFQTRVNPKLKKVKTDQIPHGFLSAYLLSKKDFLKENPDYTKEDFSVLLTAVFYHHNREDCYDPESIREYCNQYYLDYVREFLQDSGLSVHLKNKNALLFSQETKDEFAFVCEETWCEYMLVKGMLNKFDWTVSGGYEQAELTPDIQDKELCRSIKDHLNGNLRPAQEFMEVSKDRNTVVVAPTGSGKTEAALLWLDGEKGFYTLPLKVSSNAIYERIQERYCYQNVALLHSDSLNSYIKGVESDLENGYKKYEQAKLLSYPLTVCTVDQLFRFVYKALGTEIFAATLKYSKIIIDEIQSYSPRVVAALIFGLSEIHYMGGKFAIITATLPPVIKHFMKKCKLIEDRDYVFKDFSGTAGTARHRIKMEKGDFNIDEIVKAAREKKVLVICNTVTKAQEVYQEIQRKCEELDHYDIETGLLHARFIRAHRDILEKQILDFSADEDASGIWVTTQIVEASLDIDFDILYTEMCTADSLLQRMGRCNRFGKKDVSWPNVIVYINNSGRAVNGKGVYDSDIYDRSVQCLKKYEGILFSEADKTAYIDEVYDVAQIKGTVYYKKIEKYIEHFQNINPFEYGDKDVEKEFRDIRSITVMPDAIYNKNMELIESITGFLEQSHIDSGVRKVLKSKIASLTMSVPIYWEIPPGIDHKPISFLDIHRTTLRYDFDEMTGTGLGLRLDQDEEESFFV